MRTSVQLLLACIILGLTAVSWYFLQQPEQRSSARSPRVPTAVNVTLPRQGEVQDSLGVVGTLASRDAIFVTSEVSGRIRRLGFEEGQPVHAGQVLVELDDHQAQAELAVALSQLDDAEAKYRRARQLQAGRSISQAEVDELRSNLEVARARVAAAETNLRNHRILAPFDGVIGLREASVGSYVRAGDIISTLDDLNRLELRFSVPERYLSQVMPGLPLVVYSDAHPGREFQGEVRQLGIRVDPVTRTIPVRADIANRDGQLRPGQLLRGRLILAERPDSLLIPEQAILTEGDQQYTFVIRNGVAERVTVRLGRRLSGEVEVIEGLEAGDKVVVTGLARLRHGESVRILDDATAVLSASGELAQSSFN